MANDRRDDRAASGVPGPALDAPPLADAHATSFALRTPSDDSEFVDRGPELDPPAAPPPAPAALDAWTEDRLQRSSLPPSSSASLMPLHVATPLPPRTPSEPDAGDALSLIERAQTTQPLDLHTEMADRFALGDFTGSLRAAELVLGQAPSDPTAVHYARQSRDKLEGLYTSRLLSRGKMPVLSMPETEVRWLGLDARVDALLASIDGQTDVEALIQKSGLSRLDALRALVGLAEAKVIRMT